MKDIVVFQKVFISVIRQSCLGQGTVVIPALPSLNGKSHEITLTLPLIYLDFFYKSCMQETKRCSVRNRWRPNSVTPVCHKKREISIYLRVWLGLDTLRAVARTG